MKLNEIKKGQVLERYSNVFAKLNDDDHIIFYKNKECTRKDKIQNLELKDLTRDWNLVIQEIEGEYYSFISKDWTRTIITVDDLEKEYYKDFFQSGSGIIDTFALFIEKSLSLLRWK